jgi:hypothetical protein
MPEDLRDLMDGASDGPVPPLDPDELWRQGSRRRRARQAAILAPLAVLVLLVGGLAVMAGDNPGPDDDATGDDRAGEDAVFADLSSADAAVVDAYLAALDELGGRATFIDDRAAVEYAWRFECFPGLIPTDLAALGDASTALVNALERELVWSSATMVDSEAAGADLESAYAETDAAIAAYLALAPEALAGVTPEVVEVATTRLGDLEVVRVAVDQRQIGVESMIDLYGETASAVSGALGSVATGGNDLAWYNHSRLLDAGIATAETSAGVVAVPYELVPYGRLLQAAEEEDLLRSEWEDTADPARASELRNRLGTDAVRPFDAHLDEVLASVQSGTTDERTGAGVSTDGLTSVELIDAALARVDAYSAVATSSAGDQIPQVRGDAERDRAVDTACAATDDAILAVDPAAVDVTVATPPTTDVSVATSVVSESTTLISPPSTAWPSSSPGPPSTTPVSPPTTTASSGVAPDPAGSIETTSSVVASDPEPGTTVTTEDSPVP